MHQLQLTELGRTEILQINATVIAGALILLTLSGISNDDGTALPLNRSITTYGALLVIAPFAYSSIRALDGNLIKATKIMRRGFYALIGVVGALFVFNALIDLYVFVWT
jgi:hypothetical protein